jgi:hypothetical protein
MQLGWIFKVLVLTYQYDLAVRLFRGKNNSKQPFFSRNYEWGGTNLLSTLFQLCETNKKTTKNDYS